MKKKERKALEEKLLASIIKVIQDHKANLTKKTEMVFKKAVKQIVKKTDKKSTAVVKKNEVAGLNHDKIKMDGVAFVSTK